MPADKVLSRFYAEANGDRDDRALSSNGLTDFALITPEELGGARGDGGNLEQLFAAGYSACFLGAMKFVAARDKLAISNEPSIEGVVGIGATPAGFAIEVELRISLPGLPADVAQTLIERAHIVCSDATHNNIDVTLTLVD